MKPQERDEWAKWLYEAGCTDREVAKNLGISTTTAKVIRARIGKPPPLIKAWTPKELKLLWELLAQGKRHKEISRILNRTQSSIKHKINEYYPGGDFDTYHDNSLQVAQTMSLLNIGKSVNEICKEIGKARRTVRAYIKKGRAMGENYNGFEPIIRKVGVG